MSALVSLVVRTVYNLVIEVRGVQSRLDQPSLNPPIYVELLGTVQWKEWVHLQQRLKQGSDRLELGGSIRCAAGP